MSKRDKQFKIRVSSEEMTKLKTMAAEHKISAADFVRVGIFGPKYTNRMPDRDIMLSILKQITGIGNNINQTQKSVNEAAKSGILSEAQFASMHQVLRGWQNEWKSMRLEMREQFGRFGNF